MSGATENALIRHLDRPDGQEDLAFATWRPSTGTRRRTALIREPLYPRTGERHVHGNASFESAYALRVAKEAAARGEGALFVHSHPGGTGWQPLNGLDAQAEASIANLIREITGLPLVGMTFGSGDRGWSARIWNRGRGREVACTPCDSVRVVGSHLRVTFNEDLRRRPHPQPTQVRTVHAWGEEVQADLARLRVLVAGAGSVALPIVESLARTGIEHIGVMDFDRVEFVNLDRLQGATVLDALLHMPKVSVAGRLLRRAATAANPLHEFFDTSVCEPAGFEKMLDFDVIFSCVDRPWPRHVLNTIAYADLIPVIDGGLRLEPSPHGGMRNAYWRSHVATTGRPCLVCIGQYDPAHVQLERDGSLDDPTYIAGLPPESSLRMNQNVSVLSIAAASAMLNQFLSLAVAPSGLGDPGPLRHSLATHRVEHVLVSCQEGCPYASSVADGDERLDPTGPHAAAERARRARDLWRARVSSAVERVEEFAARVTRRLSQRVGG